MIKFIQLSRRIYNVKRLKEYRRMAVFVLRSMAKKREMGELFRFFEGSALRREISTQCPQFFEQATRHWFYHRSTFDERSALIRDHFRFLETRLSPEIIRRFYLGDGLVLWQGQLEDQPIVLWLGWRAGLKKEGMLFLDLALGTNHVYQLVFWLSGASNDAMTLNIGALQGLKGGADVIQALTKHLHGFRPKNLVLFAARIVAKALGVSRIRAVSNHGYYANNHIRLDRKLKGSLDTFWEEAGGVIGEDPRFFELPVLEPRKTDEEIPPRKRSLYRKRFALLDSMEAEMTARFVRPRTPKAF